MLSSGCKGNDFVAATYFAVSNVRIVIFKEDFTKNVCLYTGTVLHVMKILLINETDYFASISYFD